MIRKNVLVVETKVRHKYFKKAEHVVKKYKKKENKHDSLRIQNLFALRLHRKISPI